MRYNRRLDKIEAKLNIDNKIPHILFILPDQEEKEEIEKFKTENPGMPFELRRVVFVEPKPRQYDE